MLPHPSILLLSIDVILGTCERNKFQWDLKFFFFFFLIALHAVSHKQWWVLPKHEAGSD